MFSVGEELTAREMAERLGITATTWKNKRKKYMGHLEQFYKIDVIGHGVSLRYVIKEQLQDYEPMISPRDKRAMEEHYMGIILSEIGKPHMNLHLYSTMNDRVIATGQIAKFNHKPGTSYKYTSQGMKEMFGAQEGQWGTKGQYVKKVWAKRLYDEDYDFERLTEEQENDWKNILANSFNNNDVIVNVYSSYYVGEIEESLAKSEVWNDGLFKYQVALAEFEEKYGFTPVKVREYLIKSEDKFYEDLSALYGDYENLSMSKQEAVDKMEEIYRAYGYLPSDWV